MHLHQLDLQSALFCDGPQGIVKAIVIVELELVAVILLDDHVVILDVEYIQLCKWVSLLATIRLSALATFEWY